MSAEPKQIDLQKARRKASERFYAIGMGCLPEGHTFAFRKALSGVHWPERKHIEAPKPVTRKSLYIWLHECAHGHLGHNRSGKKPSHVIEYEAEQWAHEKMREHGIPVPRAMTKRAKQYVARKIKQAGPRAKIDPAARRFAKSR
jgi:hypothetical protein